MPNVSILKADTVVDPDETYFVPMAKVADAGAYKANLPLPADSVPLMNAEAASAGTSATWARADHVHPANTVMLETMKNYVDQKDNSLQTQIAALAQNLRFVGQTDVPADSTKFTSASGITPSQGPLPAAAPELIGFYTIVVVAGRPPHGSNIPEFDYATHDWIVCDGAAWDRLDIGATAATASTTAVTPEIAGMDDVQEVLEHLHDTMPLPATVLPTADGTAAVGASNAWARADHVHPTDVTRYAVSNPAGYVDPAGAAAAAPVQSVATRTGAIVLTHDDITDWAATLQPYALTVNVPAASTVAPRMAGVAAAGFGTKWSREDHVHPTDVTPRKGVTDGSNAAAGEIGEFISAVVQVGSALPATTGVVIDVTTISLTAGDWDVQGHVATNIAAGGHGQSMMVWASTASQTPPAQLAGGLHQIGGISTGANEQLVLPMGRMRLSLTASTTVYLSTRLTFTGTAGVYGFISARRVR